MSSPNSLLKVSTLPSIATATFCRSSAETLISSSNKLPARPVLFFSAEIDIFENIFCLASSVQILKVGIEVGMFSALLKFCNS